MRHLELEGTEYILVREWPSGQAELLRTSDCEVLHFPILFLSTATRAWRTRPVPSLEFRAFALRERAFLAELRAARLRDAESFRKGKKVEKSTSSSLESKPKEPRAGGKKTKSLDELFASLESKFGG